MKKKNLLVMLSSMLMLCGCTVNLKGFSVFNFLDSLDSKGNFLVRQFKNKIIWNKLTDCDYYQVFVKTDKSFYPVCRTDETSFTVDSSWIDAKLYVNAYYAGTIFYSDLVDLKGNYKSRTITIKDFVENEAENEKITIQGDSYYYGTNETEKHPLTESLSIPKEVKHVYAKDVTGNYRITVEKRDIDLDIELDNVNLSGGEYERIQDKELYKYARIGYAGSNDISINLTLKNENILVSAQGALNSVIVTTLNVFDGDGSLTLVGGTPKDGGGHSGYALSAKNLICFVRPGQFNLIGGSGGNGVHRSAPSSPSYPMNEDIKIYSAKLNSIAIRAGNGGKGYYGSSSQAGNGGNTYSYHKLAIEVYKTPYWFNNSLGNASPGAGGDSYWSSDRGKAGSLIKAEGEDEFKAPTITVTKDNTIPQSKLTSKGLTSIYKYNDHYYSFVNSAMTFEGANTFAKSLNACLFIVNDEAENGVYLKLTKDYEYPSTWLNLRRANTYYRFNWEDIDAHFVYANWAVGEPNNSEGKQNTGRIYNSTGLWDDINDKTKQKVLIEWFPDNFNSFANSLL